MFQRRRTERAPAPRLTLHAGRLRRAATAAVSLALLLAATASTPWAAAAPMRSYWIEEFAAAIVVDPGGDIEVTEDIRFYFEGSFEGIYRDLPVRYRDNLGFNYRLRLAIVSVTDGQGTPLRYETSNAGNGRRRIKAWVPGARDAARTVRLQYRVQRALRYFPEHDELYWNVTGNDWGVPINAASARITLPAGLQQAPRVAAYVGAYGSRGDDWSLRRVSERQVEISSNAGLAYGEGLTVVVGWDKGIVHEPGQAERAGWLLRDNWPLLLPLLVFFGMFGAWRRFGRDPDVGRSVMPVYQPPGDLTPAEIGALIDEKVDHRDIVATVVDLAVRGYLRIEEETESGWFGLTSSTTTHFVRLRGADDALKPHEREVLVGLFESGDRVAIEDLENKFYTRLGTIRDAVYGGLVGAGYFRSSPHTVRIVWLVVGIVVAVAGIPAGVRWESPAAAIGAVLSGGIIMLFSRIMPARSRSGRHKWYEVKGFEEFLGRTEGDRLREMKVDVGKFEAFLPFAMALGVAEQWGRAFEGMLHQSPAWYSGGSNAQFSPSSFSRRMGTVSQSVSSAMATAPRSSSGSSGFSSGGGFSGGGFGGGGGGAF